MKFLAGLVATIVLGQATVAGADIVTINFSATQTSAITTNIISGRLSFDDRVRTGKPTIQDDVYVRGVIAEFFDPTGLMELDINGQKFSNSIVLRMTDIEYTGDNQGLPGGTRFQAYSSMPSENLIANFQLDYAPTLFQAAQEGSAFGELGRLVNADRWRTVYPTLSFFNLNGTAQFQTSVNYSVDYSASAVPEPAAWMMMICGFGVMGYALRRRSRLGIDKPAYGATN